jgi:trigger factor
MTSALTRLSGSAFEITLTIPWADVKRIYDLVFEEIAANIEVEGFRKGKAPKDIIAGKIDKGKVYGDVVNRILPDAYAKALSDHGVKPVISPKINIVQGEEDKDWQFLIRSAEKPTVELGDYKKAVSELNTKDKIWTPDQGVAPKPEEKSAETEEQKKTKKLNAIIDRLLQVAKVELGEVFIESEQNRLLTQLIDDVRQAGLTFEQYLASSGTTQEQIKERFKQQAETSLKLEFVLEAVADDLKVEVSQEEIDTVISRETEADRKKLLTEQSYAIASILRREKTVAQLLTL